MEDLSDIPHHQRWREIIPVENGWSSDRKYRIVDLDGSEFLLRTSSSDDRQRKSLEFQMMADFSKTGVNMSLPIDHGLYDHGRRFYTLLTWVGGADAKEYLDKVPNDEQYRLGLLAGRELAKLHSLKAPAATVNWETTYGRKIDSKISRYQSCPVKIPNDEKLLDFITENREVIRGREPTYQHGDFHVGNMVITPHATIGVIDFDRASFGDPWEEFNRIIFCSEVGSSFATGRINGYFDGDVPEDFFRVLALYISVNAISAITWALQFGDAELNTMLQQASSILDFYDRFSTVIPKWYKNNEKWNDGKKNHMNISPSG